MTKGEIITKFQLYFDDSSPLSSTEESDLFDKVYNKVCTNRPWEFTKTAYSGTTSTSLPYLALPSDFIFLTQNHNHTSTGDDANGPVIFVGTDYRPYKVVSFSDRRQYRENSNACYLDIANSRLYFTKQPTSAEAVEYDYHALATALDSADTPAFPAQFHDILYHGMLIDVNIIEMTDKNRSYANENLAYYEDYLAQMSYWNANLIQLN